VSGPLLGSLTIGLGLSAPFVIYGVALLLAAAVVFFSLRNSTLTASVVDTEPAMTLGVALRNRAYRSALFSNFATGWSVYGLRVALVPLFVTWFGIDEPSKLALITAAALFPLYLNTFHAVKGVDQKLIEAGKTFGLSGFQIARRVIFPTALPGILTGVRFACSFSLLSLVLAEQVNSTAGIGYLIINAQNNQRPDIVIAGIWIYAVLGILIDFVMRGVERLVLPWRGRVSIA